MAYSTRRKSVNLSLLGIHVPRSHHKTSPPTTVPEDSSAPPAKKIKRSHSDPAVPDRPPQFAAPAAPNSSQSAANPTPPPSPPSTTAAAAIDDCNNTATTSTTTTYKKVDTQGINDDVVVATIEVLEATGNRPHLLKELAVAIAGHVQVVETSANQSAIISSRLTNFLKRPWTTLAPCPMGKALVGTHPKRLYFFLTTQPRQEIPDPDDPANKPPKPSRIVTPSLTSGPSEDEDVPVRRRRSEMSPSPELDLTSPDLADDDDELSRSTSFSTHHGSPAPGYSHSQTTPALEKDEHEFTQTASLLQQQAEEKEANSAKDAPADATTSTQTDGSITFYELDDGASQRTRDLTQVMFNQADGTLGVSKSMDILSSPMIYPHAGLGLSNAKSHLPASSLSAEMKNDQSQLWADLLNPAPVELDELDDLFASY